MIAVFKIALSGAVLAGGLIAASGASLAAPPPTGARPTTSPTITAPAGQPGTTARTLKPNTGVTGVNASKPGVLALTPNECKGLGGKVVASTLCKSGSNCATVDKYGVINTSCIDERDPK